MRRSAKLLPSPENEARWVSDEAADLIIMGPTPREKLPEISPIFKATTENCAWSTPD